MLAKNRITGPAQFLSKLDLLYASSYYGRSEVLLARLQSLTNFN